MHNFLSSFYLVGINYKKSDVSVRGKFSIDKSRSEEIFTAKRSINSPYKFFIVSTCNRTEIYGLASCSSDLALILSDGAQGSMEELENVGYTKVGKPAVEHLFDVAAGLDSQILGDYEIVGQIKQAVKTSKAFGFTNAFLERMVNEVFASAKKIRTYTDFSGGTTSVSYAAVQYLKSHKNITSFKNCLVIGAGKIGAVTCKNILDYLPQTSLTVMNRTEEKAKALEVNDRVTAVPMCSLEESLQEADVVIVATHADGHLISKMNLDAHKHPQIFIDLSIPCNVHEDVKDIDGVSLVNVDELSKINDDTLLRREAEIPRVNEFLSTHKLAFYDWLADRKYAPVLQAAKGKLLEINNETAVVNASSDKKGIQKALNRLAKKMKASNAKGCHYLTTLDEYLQSSTN